MKTVRYILATLLLVAPLVRAGEITIADPVTLAEGRVVARPQTAFGAGVYFVVWRSGYPGLGGSADILATRLEPGTLRVLDPRPITVCSYHEAQDEPQVAYRDGQFLVVWQDFRNGKDFDIRGALVDAQTGKLKREDFSIAAGEGNQVCPAATDCGDDFLVVWQDWRGEGRYGISARRVAPSGLLQGDAPMSIADLGARPATVSSGDQVLVCWVTGQPRGVTSAALLSSKEAASR